MNGYTIKRGKVRRVIIYVCIMITLLLFILPLATRIRVKEDNSYYNYNEVALYIIKYDGQLPTNFITKSQAKKLYRIGNEYYKEAWYRAIAEGKNIGGGPHYNDPENDYLNKSNISLYYGGDITLKECDIYVISNSEIAERKDRGAYRLVYCEDGSRVFYSNDHYESFSEISKWSINVVSNSFWVTFASFLLCETIIVIILFKRKKPDGITDDLKIAGKNTAIVCFCIIISPVMLVYAVFLIIKKLCEKSKE